GEPGLHFGVQLEVAGDETRGARPASPAFDRGAGGRLDRRMCREPEIVVGREQKDPAAVDEYLRVGRGSERAQTAAESRLRQAGELGGEGGHRGVMPGDTKLVNLEPLHG